MILRDYQDNIADNAVEILKQYGLCYLMLQPRVGKSATSLTAAHRFGAKRVLFLTKLKAIKSIEGDYQKLNIPFRLTVINYESVHKLIWDFDFVICDESQVLSQYPKPAMRTKALKEKINNTPVMFLSATPTAESYSQIYHQLYVSNKSPFAQFSNFYKFAKEFVDIKKRKVNGFDINDYSHAYEDKIKKVIEPYIITFSQEEAGFTSFVDEEILYVPIHENMYRLMKVLKKDRVYQMKSGDTIVCDSPVRLQSAFQQISSGTIKIDEKRIVLDPSKADFIRQRFAGRKIAIFFKFLAEKQLLEQVFPNWTNSPEEFNTSDKVFLCQMVSGREGINLSSADCLVMYNIDFSATTYWQVRARMQTRDRITASKIFWIFSERGIEKLIHKSVMNKKNYTSSYFMKEINSIG